MEKYVEKGLYPYLWLGAGLIAVYSLVSPFVRLYGSSDNNIPASQPYEGDIRVRAAMLIILLLLGAAALFLYGMRRLTSKRAAVCIMSAGFVMRAGYMLYTPFYVRGHDIGKINGSGHLAYIDTLCRTLRLPAANYGQFYHPPLAHILSALVCRVYASQTGIRSLDTIFESARLVPCFASCALLVVCYRLLGELKFDNRAKIVTIAILSFHPTFYLLSSSINNDMLMIFFFMTAFLYSVRWYRNPTFKNIAVLALAIGCAMSTKLSGAVIAVLTAILFLVVAGRAVHTRAFPALVRQFALFAAICLPLGLWYPIRNRVLFGQSLGYVMPIAKDTGLYTGYRTLFDRFAAFSAGNFFCDVHSDSELWPYVVKSSLFGEYAFPDDHLFFAGILLLANIALILLSLSAMIYALVVLRRKNGLKVWSFFIVWLTAIAAFIAFNVKYPFVCTMDFRYIVPTAISGAAFIGLLNSRQAAGRNRLLRGFSVFSIALTVVFAYASAAFYII